MNDKDTQLLLLAAAAAWWLTSRRAVKPANAQPIEKVRSSAYTTQIPNNSGNGWIYYSDGTAIGPDGAYYLNGQPVWSPGA